MVLSSTSGSAKAIFRTTSKSIFLLGMGYAFVVRPIARRESVCSAVLGVVTSPENSRFRYFLRLFN